MGRAPEQRAEDTGTHGGAYLILKPEHEDAQAGPWRVAPAEDLNWLLRLRGKGTARIHMLWGDLLGEATDVDVDRDDWDWISVPLPALPDFGQIRFHMRTLSGVIEADTGLLMLGEWRPLRETENQWTFAAADFFHAGYSDGTTQFVHFRPEYDPGDGILYGPKLPLNAGAYRLEWQLESDAPDGAEIASVVLHDYVTGERQTFPVTAGTPARMEWTQPHSHLVNWTFMYNRVANVTLRDVTLTRLAPVEVDEDPVP